MNTPINQVILGSTPMYPFEDLDSQLANLEAQRKRIQQMKQIQNQPVKLVWDDIDAEIMPLTEEQKSMLLQDQEYFEIYTKLQDMVQVEILNLVKYRIENTVEGKDLLNSQLRVLKKLKKKIIENTNKEMEAFIKFREFSKNNPGITYEEFLKSNY